MIAHMPDSHVYIVASLQWRMEYYDIDSATIMDTGKQTSTKYTFHLNLSTNYSLNIKMPRYFVLECFSRNGGIKNPLREERVLNTHLNR